MKIYTDSWHYKYVARVWSDRPSSLCWYFWKVVLTVCLWITLGALILTALSYPVIQIWVYDEALQVVSFVIWSILGSFSFYCTREWEYETGRLKRKTKPHAYKEPGLIRQYISAAHRRVCPILQYTNSERPSRSEKFPA